MPPQPSHPIQPEAGDLHGIYWRLSAMMALQWGSLGLWAVTLPSFIDANTGDRGAGMFGPSFIGDVGIAGALGAILSPVVCGVLVDRLFNIEIVIAVLHGLAAVLLVALCSAESQAVFFLITIAYFQAYAPTGALASSLVLRRLPDPTRRFSQVRSVGTAGWIAAGGVVGLWPLLGGESIEKTMMPIKLAAGCHAFTALYALTLPATPPERSRRPGGLLRAGSLWRNPKVLLFLAVSVLAAAPAKFYDSFINTYLNQHAYSYPAFLQSMGQVTEMLVMLAVPLFLGRFRLKQLFLVGALCWIIRFGLLALAGGDQHPWMVYTAMCLHGFSFVFVFILGQLYIDRLSPPEDRGAAQGLHLLATFGLGALIGAKASGWAQSVWLTPEEVTPAPYDWASFWILPCVISVLAAVLFALLFREAPRAEEKAPP